MKGNLLKKLNENTPECIKKILSKAIRLKVINNNVFKNQFNEIKTFEQKKAIMKKMKFTLEKLKKH